MFVYRRCPFSIGLPVLHGKLPLVGFGILDSSGRDSRLGRKVGTLLAKSLWDLGQFGQGFYAECKSLDSSDKDSKLGKKAGTVLTRSLWDWSQFWEGC